MFIFIIHTHACEREWSERVLSTFAWFWYRVNFSRFSNGFVSRLLMPLVRLCTFFPHDACPPHYHSSSTDTTLSSTDTTLWLRDCEKSRNVFNYKLFEFVFRRTNLAIIRVGYANICMIPIISSNSNRSLSFSLYVSLCIMYMLWLKSRNDLNPSDDRPYEVIHSEEIHIQKQRSSWKIVFIACCSIASNENM